VEKDVREPITVIIVTTGIWYILDNLALMAFGAEYRVVHTSMTGKIFSLGGLYLQQSKVYGFLIAVATALVLYWFLKHSKMGKAIRATSLDREAASLMGVNQFKIYNIAFGIGTACCGVAGCVLIPFYYVYPTVGTIFDIRAFIIVVLGGLGSIPGALLGGILIGIIQSVGAQFMAATWTEEIIYVLFLLILFVKPSGLFGNRHDF
jgi:branched-chain amino acid transport system permease protein